MEKKSRKLMYLLGGGLAFGVILGAAAFVSVKGPSIASPFYGTGDAHELTLSKTSLGLDKLGNPLPDNGKQSSTPQEFVLNEFETIKTCWASKNNDMIVRLNTKSSGNVGYLEKVEACYGMTSITIDLNYGYADILTGYEPGVWTNRYTVKPSGSAANVQLQKTITVEGNYFRIENVNTSENALIKSFTVNYGCSPESESSYEHTMEKGSSPEIVSDNPGHWFYHWNGSWRIEVDPAPRFENGHFTSTITAVEPSNTNGVWYRYQPITSGELTAVYKISLEVRLSANGTISGNGGSNSTDAPEGDWVSLISGQRTIGTDQAFRLEVKGIAELPAEGYVTVEVRNICVHRTLA